MDFGFITAGSLAVFVGAIGAWQILCFRCQVCVDSEGCVQVDGLAQLPANEPAELLQILRKGLAQPPGSHWGKRNFRVLFFWYVDVSKNTGNPPQIIPFFNRVGTIINHPFWGKPPIFETPMWISYDLITFITLWWLKAWFRLVQVEFIKMVCCWYCFFLMNHDHSTQIHGRRTPNKGVRQNIDRSILWCTPSSWRSTVLWWSFHIREVGCLWLVGSLNWCIFARVTGDPKLRATVFVVRELQN